MPQAPVATQANGPGNSGSGPVRVGAAGPNAAAGAANACHGSGTAPSLMLQPKFMKPDRAITPVTACPSISGQEYVERSAVSTVWALSECHEEAHERSAYMTQPALKWLEDEICACLHSIDQKLENLSSQVGHCQESIFDLQGKKSENIGLRPSNPDTIGTCEIVEPTKSTNTMQVVEAWAASPESAAVEEDKWAATRRLSDHEIQEAAHPSHSTRTVAAGLEAVHRTSLLEGRSGSQDELFEKVRQVMDDPESSALARVYSIVIPSVAILSSLFTVLQTLDDPPFDSATCAIVEVAVEVIFCIDLSIRFIANPHRGSFLKNPHNVVDVLCVLPLILRCSIGPELSRERRDDFPGSLLLYVLPMLRLLKTLRGFKEFNLIFQTVLQVYAETWPTMLMLFWVILLFATLMYYSEPRETIPSYAKALWFVVVTMTTVGYGDLTPSTSGGYIISSVLVSSSVFVMALPLGIIGQAVSEIWKDRDTILLRKWARERLDQWGYSAKDIPLFFSAFDSDGNGELDFNEFCDMLHEMKIDIKETRLRKLFSVFDCDDSGAVDAEEFIWHLFPGSYKQLYGKEAQEARSSAPRQSMMRSSGTGRSSSGLRSNVSSSSNQSPRLFSPAPGGSSLAGKSSFMSSMSKASSLQGKSEDEVISINKLGVPDTQEAKPGNIENEVSPVRVISIVPSGFHKPARVSESSS